MDNGNGRNREGIERLHEVNLQSVLFAKHVNKSPRTTPPSIRRRQIFTAAQSEARRRVEEAASKQGSEAPTVFIKII